MDTKIVAEELYRLADSIGVIATLMEIYTKNVTVSIAFSKSACETSIDELELSTRSSNALKRSSLMTVGKVVDSIADETLVKTRNLGRKSFMEIKNTVLSFGYSQLSEFEKILFWESILDLNTKQ